MTLRRVTFDDITPGSHCLSDASTIADLADNLSTLTAPLDDRNANWILRDPDEFGLRAPLLALERWIVTDDLIVDAVAIDSIQQGLALRTFNWEPDVPYIYSAMQIQWQREQALLSHIDATILSVTPATSTKLRSVQEVCAQLDIAFTVIPAEVVEVIGRFVGHAAAALREAAPDAPWDEYGFGVDKTYAEVLDQLYGSAAGFARSSFGVERTLFYYEVAASAQVPLVLHPRRRTEMLSIANTCNDAYRAIKATLTTKFEEPLREQLAEHAAPWDLSLPPLADVLVRTAAAHHDSLLSVAKAMKVSNSAVAFRKWLSTMQAELATNSSAGKLSALKSLRELELVAASWLQEFSLNENITHKRRRLELSWVPRVGALLSQLDISIDDPILTRKGYLSFISMWYAPPTSRA